jgi:hypothetical protein
MAKGATIVARKKAPAREVAARTSAIKVDTGIVRKARTIAEDKGIDLSEYVSDVLRVAIARDWDRIMRRVMEQEGVEE